MANPVYFYEHTPEGGAGSACVYYRSQVLVRGLNEHGYKIFQRHKDDDVNDWIPAALGADVFHTYGSIGEHFLETLRTINDLKPGIQGDGSVKCPPVTVWDCDDNTDFCHPTNSAFAVHGVRGYPDLDLLEPGDELEIEVNGERFIAWKDRVTKNGDGVLFDIKRNLELLRLKHAIQRTATGITVPSHDLADYMRKVIGAKNVYVWPNTVVPEDYREWPLVAPPEGQIRILWQGGMSHYLDWYPLRHVLRDISLKYPQVKWLIWGERFKHIHEMIPAEQVEFFPWVPYDAYKLQRGLMQADINVCPLADNIFNRGKSAIKWYEGSIWTKPEATLAANVGPYKEIQEGETGLLYNSPEDFVQKLSTLIENAELRARLGANAKKWVLDNRTLKATIPGVVEFYAELQRKRLSELITGATPRVQQTARKQIITR